MKDLHCHLLPGLDDGAQTLSDTGSMLKRAAESGIDVIAATSHFSTEGERRYEEVWDATEKIAAKYSIRLLKGMEYDLTDIADRSGKKLRSIGDSGYLLIDMNCDYIVHSMVNLFFELKLSGFKIIFAHPERMLPENELKKLLKLLEDNAIYIQIDSGSIAGCYGRRAKRNAFCILDRGGCHFLWNDAHNDRQFVQTDCRVMLEKRYGYGIFELLTEENPMALLSGGEIRSSPCRKSFWERLLKKNKETE